MMAIIWGSNYSIVKAALLDVPPLAFNGLRLTIASTIFLLAIVTRTSSPGGLSTLRRLMRSPGFWALGLVGHTAYQLLFIIALANTSASNSALIIGCTPVFVALMSAAIRSEEHTSELQSR